MARSQRSSSNLIYGLLAVAFALLLAWLWWASGHQKRSTTKPKAAPPVVAKASRPTAPAVIVPANPPPIAPSNRPVVSPGSVPPTNSWPRPVQNLFEAQLALVDQGISSGSLDGLTGSQTRAALAAFQRSQHLPPTGELDALTKEQLQLGESPYTTYTITADDLARLQPIASTWLGKSQQTALDYENILELVAEKSFAHPNFLRRLNPGVNWTNITAGTTVQVPNAAYPEPDNKAAFLLIHLSGKTLEAFDADTNLLAHFPCSIARRVEKRPVGELHVAVVAPHPNYTFDPDVFPESPEAQALKRKLILPPGPNNPVGVAWIGLDKPGYGIHGTPRPEEVGRTESHGCFRLANWNAEYLLRLVTVGTPVYVVE
jgi:lipoprotein-anchoring transpeptidase ErfK/SrfK